MCLDIAMKIAWLVFFDYLVDLALLARLIRNAYQVIRTSFELFISGYMQAESTGQDNRQSRYTRSVKS